MEEEKVSALFLVPVGPTPPTDNRVRGEEEDGSHPILFLFPLLVVLPLVPSNINGVWGPTLKVLFLLYPPPHLSLLTAAPAPGHFKNPILRLLYLPPPQEGKTEKRVGERGGGERPTLLRYLHLGRSVSLCQEGTEDRETLVSAYHHHLFPFLLFPSHLLS